MPHRVVLLHMICNRSPSATGLSATGPDSSHSADVCQPQTRNGSGSELAFVIEVMFTAH